HAARAADEAAHAEHRCRAVREHHAQRLRERERELERREDDRAQRRAAQAAHADPLDGDARIRHDARFQPAAGPEPHYRHRAALEGTRDRERRVHVAPGAAGHDEYRPPAHAYSPRRERRFAGFESVTSSWWM